MSQGKRIALSVKGLGGWVLIHYQMRLKIMAAMDLYAFNPLTLRRIEASQYSSGGKVGDSAAGYICIQAVVNIKKELGQGKGR